MQEHGTHTISKVYAEIEEAKAFEGGLGEFLVITSAENDARLQRDVRLFNQNGQAPFRVEVVFWGDIIAEVSGDEHLVAKHWKGFAPTGGGPTLEDRLATVRAEALRMNEHGENLNKGLYQGYWRDYLPSGDTQNRPVRDT